MWGQKQSNCMGIMMLFLGKERIAKGDGVQDLVHRAHGLVKEGVSWTDGFSPFQLLSMVHLLKNWVR